MSTVRLFTACVAIWGTTWLAITFQFGPVPAEVSVFYRFLLASLLLFGFCLARGLPLRLRAREHGWIALQGIFMFSVSYVYVYYAEQNVVSGLVAIGFSASPLLAMLGMRLFFRTAMTDAVILGSILGIAGITLVFWPEFAHLTGDRRTALGALYTLVAVMVASLGTLVAHRNHEAGLPLWQTMAWGMLYGALFTLGIAVALGKPLRFEPRTPYVLSLAYLAVLGSVAAFAGYLTLIRQIGPARAGYIGVMTPIVALVVSAFFEGFRWHPLTFAGIAVSVAGNVIVLRRRSVTG